jgi:hypothetical protein
MLTKALVLLYTVATFATAQSNDLLYNPGATASLDTIAIENHKTILANFILKKLNGVKIPNIPFGTEDGIHGYINNNTYVLSYVIEDQVTVVYHEEDNAITFDITNVMAKFHSNDLYAQDGILKTYGELEADIYKFDVIVGITLATIDGTNVTTGENYLLPNIQPYGVDL